MLQTSISHIRSYPSSLSAVFSLCFYCTDIRELLSVSAGVCAVWVLCMCLAFLCVLVCKVMVTLCAEVSLHNRDGRWGGAASKHVRSQRGIMVDHGLVNVCVLFECLLNTIKCFIWCDDSRSNLEREIPDLVLQHSLISIAFKICWFKIIVGLKQ